LNNNDGQTPNGTPSSDILKPFEDLAQPDFRVPMRADIQRLIHAHWRP
jgi:hypothetical protein